MAACLHHSVHRVTASGLTAAHLWDLWQEPEILEVSVRYPAQIRVGAGVRVHRSRDLMPGDITKLQGIPTTTPERTLVDMGRALPEPQVLRVLEHAVATKRVDIGRLWQLRRRVGSQGRVGAGVIDRAITALHPNAPDTESGPEATLLRLIADFDLPAPKLQWWVCVAGRRFRLDFAYPAARVALEYDGAEWHSSDADQAADRERDELLTSIGWSIVRFSAQDIRAPVDAGLFMHIRRLVTGRSHVL